MSTTKSRNRGTKGVNRKTTQQRRIHTTRNSLRELFSLQQTLRSIELATLDNIKQLVGLCRKYSNRIDTKYTTPLLNGAVSSTVEFGARLEHYASRIVKLEELNLGRVDITPDVMMFIADLSDEQMIIDSSLYNPLFDVWTELNKYAEPADILDLNEIQSHINKLHATLSTGANT